MFAMAEFSRFDLNWTSRPRSWNWRSVRANALALYLRSFNASAFGVGLSIELLMMVILGSLSTVWGAIFGAFAIIVLPNLLEGFDHAKHLIYGLVMVGIMMFAPRGLGETLFRLVTRKRSVA